jgi:hypothetical protein
MGLPRFVYFMAFDLVGCWEFIFGPETENENTKDNPCALTPMEISSIA